MLKGVFIRLDDRLDRELTDFCRNHGYKKSGLISKLIRDHIEQKTGPRDPIREAQEFGIDLTLIDENLKKTPLERIRDHEQAHKFAEALKQAGQTR